MALTTQTSNPRQEPYYALLRRPIPNEVVVTRMLRLEHPRDVIKITWKNKATGEVHSMETELNEEGLDALVVAMKLTC